MSITSIDSTIISNYTVLSTEPKEPTVTSDDGEAAVTATEETTEEPELSAANETVILIGDDEEDGQKGVIKNLLSGHFRGVSDIRLRINFQEEIAALEAANLSEATAAGVAEIAGTVANEIETFLATDGLDEETIASITGSLSAFVSGESTIATFSATEETAATGDAIAKLRSDFDALIEALNSALIVSEETTTEETTEAEGVIGFTAVTPPDGELTTTEFSVDEPATEEEVVIDGEAFIASLIESFESGMEALIASLAETSILPALSEPNGNGTAYDKFVAMYNELQEPAADTTETAKIDIES